MKNFAIVLKIFLPIVVIGFLVWAIHSFFIKPLADPHIPIAPNTFVDEIKLKTEDLRRSSRMKFSVESYNIIKYDIDIYTKAGKIDEGWGKVFLKDLDFSYLPVFVKQAYYVYDDNEWGLSKLDTIRKEVDRLLKSKYITDKKDIYAVKAILNKYDEIVSFISSIRYYTYDLAVTSIEQKFDLDLTKEYIIVADEYHNLNGYIHNCTRIMTQLEEIPGNLYERHKNYISNKVKYCLEKYTTMKSYLDYYNDIYLPIFGEFQSFENNSSIYSVSYLAYKSFLDSLKEKMKQDDKDAKSYFKNKS